MTNGFYSALDEIRGSGHVIFHAADLWHGSRFFDRRKWSPDTRRRILRDLVAIPQHFKLPVICGYLDRAKFQAEQLMRNPNTTSAHMKALEQAFAFVGAAQAADKWLTAHAPKERTMLVVEDAPNAKSAIKMLHRGYSIYPNRDIEDLPPNAFVAHHIVEEILWAQKRDSVILQIADMCAFFIRRRLARKVDSDPFYQHLMPCMEAAWFDPALGDEPLNPDNPKEPQIVWRTGRYAALASKNAASRRRRSPRGGKA